MKIRALQRGLRGPLVGVDPVDEVANAAVDTRVVGLRTAVAPGNETLQHIRGVNDGAAGVTRARVLATGCEAGAEHVVGDGRGSVLGAAGGAGDDGDGDLPQVGWQRGAALGQEAPRSRRVSIVHVAVKPYRRFVVQISCRGHSPSGNSELGPGSGVRSLGWERGVANGRARCESAGEMPDSNVVVGRAAAIGRVILDSGDADLRATAGPVLSQQISA